ncbi:MAG: hypothetical protein AB8B51_10435 [Sedimentitalea sp.]
METVIVLVALFVVAQLILGIVDMRRRNTFLAPDTRLETRANPFVAAERARAVFARASDRPPLI